MTDDRTARRAQRQPLAREPHLVAAAGVLAGHLQVAAAGADAAAGAAAGAVAHATRPPVPVEVCGRCPLGRLRDPL